MTKKNGQPGTHVRGNRGGTGNDLPDELRRATLRSLNQLWLVSGPTNLALTGIPEEDSRRARAWLKLQLHTHADAENVDFRGAVDLPVMNVTVVGQSTLTASLRRAVSWTLHEQTVRHWRFVSHLATALRGPRGVRVP